MSQLWPGFPWSCPRSSLQCGGGRSTATAQARAEQGLPARHQRSARQCSMCLSWKIHRLVMPSQLPGHQRFCWSCRSFHPDCVSVQVRCGPLPTLEAPSRLDLETATVWAPPRCCVPSARDTMTICSFATVPPGCFCLLFALHCLSSRAVSSKLGADMRLNCFSTARAAGIKRSCLGSG